MDALERFRQEKDEFFRLDPQSPLTPEQQRSFTGLRYFPANPALDLVVTLDIFPEQKTLEMQTTTGDVRTYVRLGRFAFEVDGHAGRGRRRLGGAGECRAERLHIPGEARKPECAAMPVDHKASEVARGDRFPSGA